MSGFILVNQRKDIGVEARACLDYISDNTNELHWSIISHEEASWS